MGKKKKHKCKPPIEHKEWHPELAHQVELAVLAEVENLVERVASASLQVKVCLIPLVEDRVALHVTPECCLQMF